MASPSSGSGAFECWLTVTHADQNIPPRQKSYIKQDEIHLEGIARQGLIKKVGALTEQYLPIQSCLLKRQSPA